MSMTAGKTAPRRNRIKTNTAHREKILVRIQGAAPHQRYQMQIITHTTKTYNVTNKEIIELLEQMGIPEEVTMSYFKIGKDNKIWQSIPTTKVTSELK